MDILWCRWSAGSIDTGVYLHVLRQISFLSKALAVNLTSAFPLTAVDLYVPVAEAGTQKYFGAGVAMEGTDDCVYFHMVVQAFLSVGLLTTFRAMFVVFITSVCFFMCCLSSCVLALKWHKSQY